MSQIHLHDNNSITTSSVMTSPINANEKRPIKDGVDRRGKVMLMQSYDGFTSRLYTQRGPNVLGLIFLKIEDIYHFLFKHAPLA